jgi:lipoate-protein ligase A
MSGVPIVVIADSPRPGQENMQIDHRLLLGASDPAFLRGLNPSLNTSPIIIRLYYWSEPTLSLGHFQSIHDLGNSEDTQGHLGLKDLPWVQRKTGGGAILHDQEVTYSLIVPVGCESLPLGSKGHSERLYRAVHESVVDGLVQLGMDAKLSESCTCSVGKQESEPFLCFHRRTPVDVLVGPNKVLGSAQRRVKSGLLQHGSFLISKSSEYPDLEGLGDLGNLPAIYQGFDSRGSDKARLIWQDWLESKIFSAIQCLIGPPERVLRLNPHG